MSFASEIESLLVLKAGFCTVLGCGTVRLGLLLRMHKPWSLYGAGRCQAPLVHLPRPLSS